MSLHALICLGFASLPTGADDYMTSVKPVLAKRCYSCHGAMQQKGHLRLDTAAAMHRGGDGGPAVDPAAPDDSLILLKVCDDDATTRMPPEGEPLTSDEISALRAWITAGATGPSDEPPQSDPRAHWAFQPIARPAIPIADKGENPIDAFLNVARGRLGVAPLEQADAPTRLRRVTLDLIGLSPTPDEVRAFMADPTPESYARAVERLLASPRFGERWGRHWMDVWRYSDWYGWVNEVRHSQPHIWRWRDWIVESLNADKGYDRMILEMLAGDELAPEDPDTLRATGYLVRSWFKFNRHIWLQDTVDHTAKAFLGLTMACARCHDHKYDPIAQSDYYRMRAFFEPHEIRTDAVGNGAEPTELGLVRVYDAHMEVPTFLFKRGDEMQPQSDRPLPPGLPEFLGQTEQISSIELPANSYYTPLRTEVRERERASAAATLQSAEKELNTAVKAISSKPPGDDAERLGSLRLIAAQKALIAAQTRQDFLEARIRADDVKFAKPPDSKRAEIEARIAYRLQLLAEYRSADASLAKATHALAETVFAARSGTPSDKVARQLETDRKALENAQSKQISALAAASSTKSANDYAPIAPVYPGSSTGRRTALAHWIASGKNPLTARVAVNHIWMRHFGEPLVSPVFDFGVHGNPPTHPELLDWLASELIESGWSLKHIHRLIVTSEAYQSASAWTADQPQVRLDPGNLTLWRMNSRRLEAEAVRDDVLWVSGMLDEAMGGVELDHDTALSTRRRSIYYRHAPEKQAEFLRLFDAANMEACYRRDVSIVPQQALALANSTLSLHAARTLAARLSELVGDAPTANDAFVEQAFLHVLSRPVRPEERAACLAFLQTQETRLADTSGWSTFAEGPESATPPSALPPRRARENLVHVLFNHNDFVTIR